jgi:hypothetical protein
MKRYGRYVLLIFFVAVLDNWQSIACGYESKNALPLANTQPATVPSQEKQNAKVSDLKKISRPKITVGFVMPCEQKFQPLMRTMETISKQFRGVIGRHFQTQKEFEVYAAKRMRINPSEIILTLDIANHSIVRPLLRELSDGKVRVISVEVTSTISLLLLNSDNEVIYRKDWEDTQYLEPYLFDHDFLQELIYRKKIESPKLFANPRMTDDEFFAHFMLSMYKVTGDKYGVLDCARVRKASVKMAREVMGNIEVIDAKDLCPKQVSVDKPQMEDTTKRKTGGALPSTQPTSDSDELINKDSQKEEASHE